METANTLSEAIDRSILRNCSVKLTVGNVNILWLELEANEDAYGEFDLCRVGPGEYDVWGWSDSTPKDQTDWRLLVEEVR